MANCVLVTGGFDPLHSGHIQYFIEAKKLGDRLVVGLNSDEWLTRKKGKPFMSWEERHSVVSNLSMVDEVIDFVDDNDTAVHAIAQCLGKYETVIFANGGDRSKLEQLPEYQYYNILDMNRLTFVCGVGGENKKNSSSTLLSDWLGESRERDWGYWRVLEEAGNYKIKELVIKPGQSLSDQKHKLRHEHWYVLQGEVEIVTERETSWNTIVLKQNMSYIIPAETWHLAKNPNLDNNTHILEIQYGTECTEEDIVRRTK